MDHSVTERAVLAMFSAHSWVEMRIYCHLTIHRGRVCWLYPAEQLSCCLLSMLLTSIFKWALLLDLEFTGRRLKSLWQLRTHAGLFESEADPNEEEEVPRMSVIASCSAYVPKVFPDANRFLTLDSQPCARHGHNLFLCRLPYVYVSSSRYIF